MSLHFVMGSRGSEQLSYNNYIFLLNKTFKERTYWTCKIKGCGATIILSNGNKMLESAKGTHNHEDDKAKLEKMEFKERLFKRVLENPKGSVVKMYREELSNFTTSLENKNHLPSFKSIERKCYQMRSLQKNGDGSGSLTKGIKTLLPKGAISNKQNQRKSFATCSPQSLADSALTISVKDTLTTSDLQKPTTSSEQAVIHDLNSVKRENDTQSSADTGNNITSCQADTSLSHPQKIIGQEIVKTEENLEEFAFLLSSPSSSKDSTNHALETLSSFIENLGSSEESNPRVRVVRAINKGVKRPREDAPVACSSNDASVACSSKNVSEANQLKDRFDTFGVFVASILRNLDQKSCANVQKAIIDLLFNAESGPLISKEKTSAEGNKDSIINAPHKTVADVLAFLQSSDPCFRDPSYLVLESERSSPLIQKTVYPEESKSKFHSLKSYQKGALRPHQNSSIAACSSKYDPPQNFDEPPAKRPKDHFNAFGLFVVSKLRTMDCKLCSFLQKTISDLLYEAELGLFLTPEEKTFFQVKNDSIINKLHEAVAGTSYTDDSL